MASELENITEVIEELDNQTKELKNFSNVLTKIDELSKHVESLIGSTNTNSKKYEEVVIQLEKRKKELNTEVKEVFSLARQTNDNIEKRFDLMEESFTKKVEEASKDINIDEKLKSITKNFDKKNEELTSTLANNQKLIIEEINALKEQLGKKKGFMF